MLSRGPAASPADEGTPAEDCAGWLVGQLRGGAVWHARWLASQPPAQSCRQLHRKLPAPTPTTYCHHGASATARVQTAKGDYRDLTGHVPLCAPKPTHRQ